jgi:hypothetical protein
MTDEQPFRFLTNDQFMALAAKERASYLSRAAQEIETRQRLIRAQMELLNKQKPPEG